MSKNGKVMVYSAITEAEVMRQYARGAAEAESTGYVPISEAWDHNTLTVTYQYRGEDSVDGHGGPAGKRQGEGGFWSRLHSRLGWR